MDDLTSFAYLPIEERRTYLCSKIFFLHTYKFDLKCLQADKFHSFLHNKLQFNFSVRISCLIEHYINNRRVGVCLMPFFSYFPHKSCLDCIPAFI